MGSPGGTRGAGVEWVGGGRTGIDFAAEAEDGLADPGADDGAVLLLVVDDMVLPALDVVARRLVPSRGQGGERLELVAWQECEMASFSQMAKQGNVPQNCITSCGGPPRRGGR